MGTPHYGPLVPLTRDQLLDPRTVLGRLLSAPAVATESQTARIRRQALGVVAGSNLRMASTRGRRGFCNGASAALCLGLSAPLARLHSGQRTLQGLKGHGMGSSMLPPNFGARIAVAKLGAASCAQVPFRFDSLRCF